MPNVQIVTSTMKSTEVEKLAMSDIPFLIKKEFTVKNQVYCEVKMLVRKENKND